MVSPETLQKQWVLERIQHLNPSGAIAVSANCASVCFYRHIKCSVGEENPSKMANRRGNLGVLDGMLSVGISQCKKGVLRFHSEPRDLGIQLKKEDRVWSKSLKLARDSLRREATRQRLPDREDTQGRCCFKCFTRSGGHNREILSSCKSQLDNKEA